MKKVIMKSVLATVAGIGLMASSANAGGINFSFSGKYDLKDLVVSDNSTFRQTMQFSDVLATTFYPTTDALFSDSGIEYIILKDFILNNSYSSEYSSLLKTTIYSYTFGNSPIADGFKLYDDNNKLLFEADVVLDTLVTYNTTAEINSELAMNLINITPIDYVSGSSEIVDSFLQNSNGAGGGVSLTLQLANNFHNTLQGTIPTSQATFSGTAKPIPEPGVTLLFGLGVAGFVGMIRRRNTLAD